MPVCAWWVDGKPPPLSISSTPAHRWHAPVGCVCACVWISAGTRVLGGRLFSEWGGTRSNRSNWYADSPYYTTFAYCMAVVYGKWGKVQKWWRGERFAATTPCLKQRLGNALSLRRVSQSVFVRLLVPAGLFIFLVSSGAEQDGTGGDKEARQWLPSHHLWHWNAHSVSNALPYRKEAREKFNPQ